MRRLDQLSQIARNYDLFIIDIWGVLHNGQELFPDTLRTLNALKALNKVTLLLSNSPRRLDVNRQRLASMGLATDSYTDIYTSGEHCYQGLANKTIALLNPRQKNYYFMGLREDLGIIEDIADYHEVTTITAADFIVCSGTHDDNSNPLIYRSLLETAARKQLPMLCVNPDLEVYIGAQRIYCAGSVAALYQQLGGQVQYFGKPFPDFYEAALKPYTHIPRQRILAIGDALRTDILGSQLQAINSALVLSGIQSEADLDQAIISPIDNTPVLPLPTYILNNLSF